MKNTILFTGVLSAITLLIGNIFKTFHLPGTGLIITLAIALFVIVFIPMVVLKTFQSENTLRSKVRITFGNLLALIGVTGVLFKIMHWPTANILLCSSMIFFITAYIPILLYKTFNSKDDLINKIRWSLGYIVIALFSTGILFKIMHWQFALNLTYITFSFLILVFLPFYFFSKINRSNLFDSIINTVYVMVIGGVIYTLIDLSNI
tara:strand:- start:3281 stop:3898 length:618 start_codon:yes stop_codon:yes gene_type:complete